MAAGSSLPVQGVMLATDDGVGAGVALATPRETIGDMERRVTFEFKCGGVTVARRGRGGGGGVGRGVGATCKTFTRRIAITASA
jgi:hypothetical protein